MKYTEHFENTSIYRFDIQIRISEPNNLDFITLHRRVEKAIKENDKRYDKEDNQLKDFITNKIYHKIREVHHNYYGEINKVVISNYQERQGSLIVSFTMIIISALTTYDTVRGAIDRVLEDFDTDFKRTTNDQFQVESYIIASGELYNSSRINQDNALDTKTDLHINRPSIGFNIDDCIKLIQLLNTSNQNNTSKEKQEKLNITKYISIAIACLVTGFLIWNQFFNNTDQIKDIVHTELEKYRNQEKVDESYNYYLFQKYSSIQDKKVAPIKTDTLK